MSADPPKARGLRWRSGRAIWRASKAAIAAGYPCKSANLEWLKHDPDALIERCRRLEREVSDYMSDPERRPLGSFRVKRAASWSKVGLIYFVECDGMIKIGFTTDLHGRLLQLQANTLRAVTLMGSMPGTPEIEKFLHWQFRNFHHRGEWFRLTEPALEFVRMHLWTGTPAEPVRRRHRSARRTPKHEAMNV